MKNDRLKLIIRVALGCLITAVTVLAATLFTAGTYGDKRLAGRTLSKVTYSSPPQKDEFIEISCADCGRKAVLTLDFTNGQALLYLKPEDITGSAGYEATGKLQINRELIAALCDSAGGITLSINDAESDCTAGQWRFTGNQIANLLHSESNDNYDIVLAQCLRTIFCKGLQKEQIYIILDNSTHNNLPYSKFESIANNSAAWLPDICVVN